jgi:hypothetical protein
MKIDSRRTNLSPIITLQSHSYIVRHERFASSRYGCVAAGTVLTAEEPLKAVEVSHEQKGDHARKHLMHAGMSAAAASHGELLRRVLPCKVSYKPSEPSWNYKAQ